MGGTGGLEPRHPLRVKNRRQCDSESSKNRHPFPLRDARARCSEPVMSTAVRSHGKDVPSK